MKIFKKRWEGLDLYHLIQSSGCASTCCVCFQFVSVFVFRRKMYVNNVKTNAKINQK